MSRFAVENLDQEERAFIESIEGLHRSIEALKVVYPNGRMRVALEGMQASNAALAAAAIRSRN
jgi:hypothetical protein